MLQSLRRDMGTAHRCRTRPSHRTGPTKIEITFWRYDFYHKPLWAILDVSNFDLRIFKTSIPQPRTCMTCDLLHHPVDFDWHLLWNKMMTWNSNAPPVRINLSQDDVDPAFAHEKWMDCLSCDKTESWWVQSPLKKVLNAFLSAILSPLRTFWRMVCYYIYTVWYILSELKVLHLLGCSKSLTAEWKWESVTIISLTKYLTSGWDCRMKNIILEMMSNVKRPLFWRNLCM